MSVHVYRSNHGRELVRSVEICLLHTAALSLSVAIFITGCANKCDSLDRPEEL